MPWVMETAFPLAERLATEYYADLEEMSEICARQTNAENVEERHVRKAQEELFRLGTRPKRWRKRREAEVAGGSFLVGAAFGAPDVISFFCDPPGPWKTVETIAVVVVFVIGAFFAIHGFLRGNPDA